MQRRRSFTVISGKQRKKKPGEKVFYIVLLMAVSVLVLQMVFSLGRNVLASLFVETVVSENSVLEQTVSVSGVIVRDERVVAAPLTGTLRWELPEGERLSQGATVAIITSNGEMAQKVTAPVPGILIQQLDGLEGELQPQSMGEIRPGKSMESKPQRVEDEQEVQQGSILFKIVDNYAWYFVTEMTHEQYELFRNVTSIPLRIRFAEEQELQSRSILLAEYDDTVTVAFELQKDLIEGFTERFADAELIVQGTRGIVLPSSALLLRGEETGVYLLDKSVVRYRTVDVLDVAGDQVVVEGLRMGFPIITNPSLVREGQRL